MLAVFCLSSCISHRQVEQPVVEENTVVVGIEQKSNLKYDYPTVATVNVDDSIYAMDVDVQRAISESQTIREYGYYIFEDKALYNTLYTGLQQGQLEIDISEYKASKGYVNEMMYSLILGCPDFWYMSTRYSVAHIDGTATRVILERRYSEEQQAVLAAELQENLAEIKEHFPYDACYYVQYRWLYDLLKDNIQYNGEIENKDGVTAGLLFGQGDCDAFALSYVYLCREFGLPCMTDTMKCGSSPHIWNKILYNGLWYNVDLTRNKSDGFMQPLSKWDYDYAIDYYKYPTPYATPNYLVID